MTNPLMTMASNNLRNVHRLIGEATKAQPPESSFVADLNASIERDAAENVRTPSKFYKPSSMHCIRNMYFQRIGTPPDGSRRSAQLIGMGWCGTDRHDRIQRAIAKMQEQGMDCVYVDVAEYIEKNGLDHLTVVSKQGMETKLFDKNLNMSFLCDGIIVYKGVTYVFEYKTEKSSKFFDRQDVDTYHHYQGTSYGISLRIDRTLFLYENRDTCDRKAFVFDVSDSAKYTVVSRIEECDGYVTRLICPPKPEEVDKKACQYCDYKTSCRKAGK